MGLKYYADTNNAPVSDLLRQANINTENQLMDFSDSSCQYCPEAVISTGSYIIFYQGGKIDHGTHVPVPVTKTSAEINYNAALNAGMDLAHFRILIHKLLSKDPDIVPEEAPLIILDSNSEVCMTNNGNDTKHTRHIARRAQKLQNAQDLLV